MTELEQFTADSHTAPYLVVLGHLQNQLLKLGIEAWPLRGRDGDRKLPTFSSPVAMPTQNRLRLDQHAHQNCTAHLWLSAAMIVRSAAFSRGLLTWRRTTRTWCRRRSSSASGLWSRSLTL